MFIGAGGGGGGGMNSYSSYSAYQQTSSSVAESPQISGGSFSPGGGGGHLAGTGSAFTADGGNITGSRSYAAGSGGGSGMGASASSIAMGGSNMMAERSAIADQGGLNSVGSGYDTVGGNSIGGYESLTSSAPADYEDIDHGNLFDESNRVSIS